MAVALGAFRKVIHSREVRPHSFSRCTFSFHPLIIHERSFLSCEMREKKLKHLSSTLETHFRIAKYGKFCRNSIPNQNFQPEINPHEFYHIFPFSILHWRANKKIKIKSASFYEFQFFHFKSFDFSLVPAFLKQPFCASCLFIFVLNPVTDKSLGFAVI